MSTASSQPDFVALAAIAQPHGVRGRVKLRLFAESAASFRALIKHIILENGTPLALRITNDASNATDTTLIAEIETITSREHAEKMRGTLLGVKREDLPEIDNDDGFYIHDLIGTQVTNVQQKYIGVVTDIMNYGAGDIVQITTENGQELLYSFDEATFPKIDMENGMITLNPPDILSGEPTDREAS